MAIKYYINFADELFILKELERGETRVKTEAIFVTSDAIKFHKLPDGSTGIMISHWDKDFKEPNGLQDKKRILLVAMGI